MAYLEPLGDPSLLPVLVWRPARFVHYRNIRPRLHAFAPSALFVPICGQFITPPGYYGETVERCEACERRIVRTLIET